MVGLLGLLMAVERVFWKVSRMAANLDEMSGSGTDSRMVSL